MSSERTIKTGILIVLACVLAYMAYVGLMSWASAVLAALVAAVAFSFIIVIPADPPEFADDYLRYRGSSLPWSEIQQMSVNYLSKHPRFTISAGTQQIALSTRTKAYNRQIEDTVAAKAGLALNASVLGGSVKAWTKPGAAFVPVEYYENTTELIIRWATNWRLVALLFGGFTLLLIGLFYGLQFAAQYALL
jgi:hypothetical protein